MNKIECPHCGKENEIDSSDWPQDCSSESAWECSHCGKAFKFGVTCEIEVR